MTIKLKPSDYAITPAKRYQVEYETYSNDHKVMDSWTNKMMGRYPTKAKAQARARVLNSRQGA